MVIAILTVSVLGIAIGSARLDGASIRPIALSFWPNSSGSREESSRLSGRAHPEGYSIGGICGRRAR